jgi:hypothetical protein
MIQSKLHWLATQSDTTRDVSSAASCLLWLRFTLSVLALFICLLGFSHLPLFCGGNATFRASLQSFACQQKYGITHGSFATTMDRRMNNTVLIRRWRESPVELLSATRHLCKVPSTSMSVQTVRWACGHSPTSTVGSSCFVADSPICHLHNVLFGRLGDSFASSRGAKLGRSVNF